MYVTPNKKFAFIAHPRTASRATGKSLCLPHFEKTGHHNFDRELCKRITGSGGIVACTVRNPYDLVVSWFFNEHFREEGRHKPGEFIPWVLKNRLKHNQWLRMDIGVDLYHYGLPVCNHVLRYEELEKNLRHLATLTGHPYCQTAPYGVLPRDRDYRVYYNDETQEIVANHFARDFEKTGYTF